MNVKKILGIIGLSVIGVMIATVLVLSLVPVKLAPNFETPAKIVAYKYNGSTLEQSTTIAADEKEQFDKLHNGFNTMGQFTVMSQLFSGLGGVSPQLVGPSSTSKSFNNLRNEHQTGYWVELVYSDTSLTENNPFLKKIDGSIFYPSGGTTKVQYYAIGVWVDDTSDIQECKIYVRTSTVSTSTQYYYTAFYNTKILFDLVDKLDYSGVV